VSILNIVLVIPIYIYYSHLKLSGWSCRGS